MDKEIYLSDYSYHLPPEKIPLFPNPDKHKTNLLLYQHTTISHHSIENIIELIPPNASLFFNETKVIPARLLFTKETGASIEIFLLRPSSATQNEALESHSANKWNCLIKNKKKWKEKQLFLEKQTTFGKTILCAERTELENEILFQWNQNISFLEILRIFGNIPLPPYIKRPPTKNDTNDYQTIFSKNNGSVAAPTAGLHFTKHILEELEKKQIPLHFLTLHIGAGTFLPIKTENVKHHTMHTEHIIIQKKNILHLLNSKYNIAVGTTSLRTLESMYWYGAMLLENPNARFFIPKLYPYNNTHNHIEKEKAIEAVIMKMEKEKTDILQGETEIFIFPGYHFKMVQGLITNFHQPSSTLILLVAAFVGDDWKKIYQEALQNDYKFLSYGDASLLIP